MALIVDRSKAGLPAGYWLWQEKGGRAAAATGARGRPAARPGARVRLIRQFAQSGLALRLASVRPPTGGFQ